MSARHDAGDREPAAHRPGATHRCTRRTIASSGISKISSARASAARPQTHAERGRAQQRRPVPQRRRGSSNAPTTIRPVIVSDMTSPSFTQMFGEIAAIPAATRPTPVASPTRRPEQPDEQHEDRAEHHHRVAVLAHVVVERTRLTIHESGGWSTSHDTGASTITVSGGWSAAGGAFSRDA